MGEETAPFKESRAHPCLVNSLGRAYVLIWDKKIDHVPAAKRVAKLIHSSIKKWATEMPFTNYAIIAKTEIF